MNRIKKLLILFCICLTLLAFPVFAQEQPAPSQSLEKELPTTEQTDLAISQTKSRLAELSKEDPQSQELDKLVGIYEQIKTKLQELQKYQPALDEFQKARTEAPQRLKEVKDQITQTPTQAELPSEMAAESVSELEQHASLLEADLAQARKNLADRDNEVKRRATRRSEIPNSTTEAKNDLKAIEEQLAALTDDPQKPELSQAQRNLLRIRRLTRQKELELYEQEILSYDARGELLPARRELALVQANFLEQKVKKAQELLAQKKSLQARQILEQTQKAQQEALDAHPVIRDLTETNTKLAELSSGPHGLVAANSLHVATLEKIKTNLALLEKDFKSVKEKVQTVGLTDVIGVILLKRRDSLPDIRPHLHNIKSRKDEISNARFEWLKYDDQYLELANLELAVQNLAAEYSLTTEQLQDMDNQIRQAITAQRDLLQSLTSNYETFFTTLSELDAGERQYVNVIGQYSEFINENILWTKNTNVINLQTLITASKTFLKICSPRGWWGICQTFWKDLHNHPIVYILYLIMFSLFALLKKKLTRRMKLIALRIEKKYADRFWYSPQALLYTIIKALFLPAIVFIISWQINHSPHKTDFAETVALGLMNLAGAILLFEFFRFSLAPNGLLIKHFNLPEKAATFLYRHLFWLAMAMLPLIFIIFIVEQQGVIHDRESLGRLALMARLILLTIFFAIVLRPSGPLMKVILEHYPLGWLERLRYIWYSLVIFLPPILTLTATLGYQYAAQQLSQCLLNTILLILVISFVVAFLLRWVSVAQKKLTYKKALHNREQVEETKEDYHQDIGHISRQTRNYINIMAILATFVGLWFIWSDNLPALGIFNKIELWQTTMNQKPVSITITDLCTAVFILFITFITTRNVLSILEIGVLQRLPLDSGMRFAIVTLTRYLIVITGVVMAFTAIGIGWAKVQWLVAAMTVGLGFGLQEIFANFISGLIILFEQPMRIGDTVTVGDISGTVTRIKIRATTILGWDRKELVVPNKEFITGRLINWSLSDNVLRLVFPVGIAYGSDTALTEKTLYEVARKHSGVLKDPEPVVIFKGFGSSSLDFELRVYIPDINSYLNVWHEINLAIDNAFRKEKIEIAFPQQDLHVRSFQPPVPVNLQTQKPE